MRVRERKRIEHLTAGKVGRSPLTVKKDIVAVLEQIDQARREKRDVYAMPKSTRRMRQELENRGFKVEDTGMVWHVTWGTN